jgi:hypothetical protein
MTTPHAGSAGTPDAGKKASGSSAGSNPPLGPSASPPQPVKGTFEWEEGKTDENFNLKPNVNRAMPIPEDQRKISGEVYEIRGVLRLLKEQGEFSKKKTVTIPATMTRLIKNS